MVRRMFRIIRIRQRSVRRSWRDPVVSRSYRQLNMVSDNLPSVIPLRQPTADPMARARAKPEMALARIRPLKAEVKPEAVELILNSTSAALCAGKDQNAECGSAYISTPGRLYVPRKTGWCRIHTHDWAQKCRSRRMSLRRSVCGFDAHSVGKSRSRLASPRKPASTVTDGLFVPSIGILSISAFATTICRGKNLHCIHCI